MTELNDLLKKQYITDAYLRIRQETHDRYTVPNVSFAEWALRCMLWQGNERVLDVGCGNGLYFTKLKLTHPNVQYFGIDLFPHMLTVHPSKVNLMISDAMQLPYADHSFDVVMANHMLYHVPNIEDAIQEFKRVLKPGGILMTATNSLNNMPELQVLMRRAIVLLSRSAGSANVRAPTLSSDSFALENGTRLLARHFYAVVRHDLPSALVFPDTEPAMAYLESTRDLREGQLPNDVEWDDVMVIMRQQINQLVKHLGELVINKSTGVLLASDTGGFIQPFLKFSQQVNGK
jgi:SAM-dependent methyltransferase